MLVKRYQWTKNFTNGDKYNGEAVGDNVKDGIGEYYWAATGAVYKGSWANDRPHGEGVMTVPGSSSTAVPSTSGSINFGSDGYTYNGHYENGVRCGNGTCHFTSGRVYTGEWRHDEMEGQGVLRGAPGGLDNFVEYKGPFLRGRRHGAGGHCTYTNGDAYIGEWMQGKRHGHGTWTLAPPTTASQSVSGGTQRSPSVDSPTPTEYRGAFLQDVPACTSGGEIAYADGSRYVGGVAGAALAREGSGVHHLANGDTYEGGFHSNARDGEGLLRQAVDGATYQGSWRSGKLDGRVVFRKPNTPSSASAPFNGADGSGRKGSSTTGSSLEVVAYTGPCVQGDFTGAAAQVTFSDHSTYKGEVQRSEPSGRGVLENRLLFTSLADGGYDTQPSPTGSGEVLLVRYEGTFTAGLPDGDGSGTFRAAPSASASPQREGDSADVSPAAMTLPAGAHGCRIVFPHSGGTYVGRWTRGLPCGVGKWGWDDGDAYVGPVDRGLPSGRGTYQSASSTYDGEFVAGQPSQRGKYENALLKEVYDGEWARGLFHGQGDWHIRGRDPLEFCGAWKNGFPSGHGVEVRSSACADLAKDPVFSGVPTRYDGEFVRGHYGGTGVLLNTEDPETKYTGEFDAADGSRTGDGVLMLSDGTSVKGSFVHGQPHGSRLTVTFPGKLLFTGAYEHGRPTGTGEIEYQNGDRYRGGVESAGTGGATAEATPAEWLPQRHGEGTFTFVEGNLLTCTWQHNVLNGEGTYTVAATGEVSQRRYVNGVVETTIKASAENVFTAENELPNTLSEDAFRRANADSKKPFPFVRKGLGGGTAATSSVKTGTVGKGNASDTSGELHGSSESLPKRRSPSGSVVPGKQPNHSPRPPRALQSPGSATKTPTETPGSRGGGRRKSSGLGPSTTHGAGTPAASTRKVSKAAAAAGGHASPVDANREAAVAVRAAPVGHSPVSPAAVSPRQRSKAEVRDAVAKRMRRSVDKASLSAGPPSATAGAAPVPASNGKRPSLVEVFQQNVNRLDNTAGTPSASTTNDDTMSCGRTDSSAGARAGASDTPAAVSEPRADRSAPSRHPLKGRLKTMMEEASAIRSSKEDEVHNLTEELRVLNEKIWQLRFSMDARKPGGGSAPTRSKDAARMAVMLADRRGTVDKLQCLLQLPENA